MFSFELRDKPPSVFYQHETLFGRKFSATSATVLRRFAHDFTEQLIEAV